MAAPIPIANLYYLFCYAWGHFREGETLTVGAIDSPEVVNLFAKVLINGLTRLIRRGLDRGYVSFEEDLRVIRGRILLGPTIKRNLLKKGQAECLFDELSHDVLHNRIIKATLGLLLRIDNLDHDIRHEVRLIDRELSSVSVVRINKTDFRRIQIHRNNAYYNLLLHICELIYDLLLPTEAAGRFRFSDISKDETRMSSVFEEFVRKFYHLEQNRYSVRRENIAWISTRVTEHDKNYLPAMRTDICLDLNARKIIIDAKFHTETFSSYHGSKKVKSADLYQLFSYLINAQADISEPKSLEGMLLYPTIKEDVALDYVLAGHRVRVATVDLTADWKNIHRRLLDLIAPEVAKPPMSFTGGVQ